jgi:hypothetical protein
MAPQPKKAMQLHFIQILSGLAALAAGSLIGLGFGAVQDAAARRYQRLQNSGELSNGWAVMPGSMRRVGYLLVALAGVQLICPLLFSNGCQWWVSGGVVAGYGWSLWRKLRHAIGAPRM